MEADKPNFNQLMPDTIGLCSDHAGYFVKQYIKTFFNQIQQPYYDFGCDSAERCDYPDFAHKLGRAIDSGTIARGIAVCGSGQGMSVTLNHHRAVRCALCWNVEIAALSRQHNDANVLALPGRYLSLDQTKAIVKAFLETPFEGGRHIARVKKILDC